MFRSLLVFQSDTNASTFSFLRARAHTHTHIYKERKWGMSESWARIYSFAPKSIKLTWVTVITFHRLRKMDILIVIRCNFVTEFELFFQVHRQSELTVCTPCHRRQRNVRTDSPMTIKSLWNDHWKQFMRLILYFRMLSSFSFTGYNVCCSITPSTGKWIELTFYECEL